MNSERTSSGLL